MAEYTNATVQTVAQNNNVLFSDSPVPSTNSSIVHRQGSGLVNLRGLTGQCRARFKVFFSGNVAIPTGGTIAPITLSLSIEGEPVNSSTMISTPADAGDFNNISSALFIDVPRGSNYTVAVKNTGVDPIEIQNANIIIERVA